MPVVTGDGCEYDAYVAPVGVMYVAYTHPDAYTLNAAAAAAGRRDSIRKTYQSAMYQHSHGNARIRIWVVVAMYPIASYSKCNLSSISSTSEHAWRILVCIPRACKPCTNVHTRYTRRTLHTATRTRDNSTRAGAAWA